MQKVLEHHMQAFGEGVGSILSDFDDTSCIINPQGTHHGMAEIRSFFMACNTELRVYSGTVREE